MTRSLPFNAIFAVVPTPLLILDTDKIIVGMNDAYLHTTNRTREDLVGRHVFEAFPESGERLKMFEDAFTKALSGEENKLIEVPYSIPRPASEGGGVKQIFWTCIQTPIFEDGVVKFMMQNAVDVTEQFETEQQNRVISTELDHRVKNILAIVSTIGRRTGRDAITIDGFLKTFDARLQAMARTHTLLANSKWSGANLRALVEQELAPFGAHEMIRIDGPDVMLDARRAQALSMAVHELATNASKYGALSPVGGDLKVNWFVLPEGGFEFTWRETLSQPLLPPTHRSFGSIIIDDVTPRQMDGKVRRVYEPDGVSFTLTTSAPEPFRIFQT